MRRRGFTLTEMLVVIGILIAVTSMVIYFYGNNREATKFAEGGRIAQSVVAGARDRAAHAQAERGIQLILDPSDMSLATGFVYVDKLEPQRYGTGPGGSGLMFRIEREDQDGNGVGQDAVNPSPTRVRGIGTDWLQLKANGFLGDTFRVQIPIKRGKWYVGTNLRQGANAGEELFDISPPYIEHDALHPWPDATAVDVASANSSMSLEVKEDILPNQVPTSLPSGMVIDLDWCERMPASRIIEFTPAGAVAGASGAQGSIFLLLNNIGDASANLSPSSPMNQGEKRVLAISPSGHAQSFDANLEDLDNDGKPDDLFRYAKQ